MVENEKKSSPHDILRVIFRRRWLFVIGFVAFAVIAMLGAHYLPLRYTASTIFERRSDVTAGESLSKQEPSYITTLKLTLEHKLSGYQAIAQVVEDLGMTRGMEHGQDGQLTDTGKRQKEELIHSLQKAVKVNWQAKSEGVDLVEVEVTYSDPILAREIPNRLARNYINQVSDEIVRNLNESSNFLKTSVDNARDRALELEKEKAEFERAHIGMLPDNPQALFEQIQRTQADVDTARNNYTKAQIKLARLSAMSKTPREPTTQPDGVAVKVANPDIPAMKQLLQQAKADLYRLKTEKLMKDAHPQVEAVNRMIADYEKQIAEMPAEIEWSQIYSSPMTVADDSWLIRIAEAEAEVKMAAEDLDRQENRLSRYTTSIGEWGPIQQEYRSYVEKLTNANAEVQSWQSRLDINKMQLQAEVAKKGTHLNAIQPARTPLRPSFPSLLIVIGFAIGGGIAFGLGMVYLAGSLDRTITTPEEARQYFNVPIHGVIGEITSPYQRAAKRWTRYVLGPLTLIILVLALTFSTVSIVLFLQYPDSYKQWKASPSRFIYQSIAGKPNNPV